MGSPTNGNSDCFQDFFYFKFERITTQHFAIEVFRTFDL